MYDEKPMSTERNSIMKEAPIRMITLSPFRVASVYGFGAQPESEALQKLQAWAGPRGFLDRPGEHRTFGFNNPSPSPGSPNYGYEIWITVGPEVQASGDVEIKDFPGGLYAVLKWDGMGDPNESIPAAWMQLEKWRESSSYQMGSHQWLEEHLPAVSGADNDFCLDLYMPIAEKG